MPILKPQQIKLLLVEHHEEDALCLREQLATVRHTRFALTHVSTLSSAFQSLNQEAFDLILLALDLPDSQGLATFLTLERIIPNLPIVLLTNFNDESLALQAIREGAQDYLIKGQTTPEQLIRSLNYAIERMHHLQKISQSELRLQQLNQNLEQQVQTSISQLKRQQQQLQKLFFLATRDRVTGIANRYRLEDFLAQEWGNAIRNKFFLSIIMIDIDRFKLYNDTYGHLQGDLCLRQVAQAIESTLQRSKDLVARYGGEEFLVILPDVNLEGALVVAEKIRSQVKTLNIPHSTSGISPHLTVSLGVASTIPELNSQAETLIEAADRALYLAKQKGRDRLEINTSPTNS